ncbi:hypothetical protein SOVF_158060 [Spinacia oleracea]|nr:hypothetical protein SOVF_158060 [Spinacia oleracea]
MVSRVGGYTVPPDFILLTLPSFLMAVVEAELKLPADSYTANLVINEGESVYDYCWYPYIFSLVQAALLPCTHCYAGMQTLGVLPTDEKLSAIYLLRDPNRQQGILLSSYHLKSMKDFIKRCYLCFSGNMYDYW